ncbi:MAG: hypothetical protein P3M73_00240 [Candidatus Hodgkinia cicadicola]|nr:MAG: hypothetical protein P3M73_00240 [Candidatus Hodgkinia cicadicola]
MRNTISTGFVGIILGSPSVVNIGDYNALNLEPELSVAYLRAPPANVWNSVKFVTVPPKLVGTFTSPVGTHTLRKLAEVVLTLGVALAPKF